MTDYQTNNPKYFASGDAVERRRGSGERGG